MRRSSWRLQRLMTLGTFHSHHLENAIDGKVSTLVSDGCINLRELRACALGAERVHAQLRGEGLLNLGQVERLYSNPAARLAP